MNNSLFDVASGHWHVVLLYLIPALINVGILSYIISRFKPGSVNREVAVFIALVAFAQFSDGMLHMCIQREAALAWARISFGPWMLFPALGITLVFRMYKPDAKKIQWLCHSFFIGSTIMMFFLIGHYDLVQPAYSDTWGWLANPAQNSFSTIIYIFISLTLLMMPMLLWYFFFTTPKAARFRFEAMILAIGITIPFVGGVICEAVFPMVFGMDAIPITTPLLTLFSSAVVMVLVRQESLNFSPWHQVDRLMHTISDGIMMINNHGIIRYVNPTLCRLLGYSEEELVGNSANALVATPSMKNEWLSGAQNELQVKTKSGKAEWMLSTSTPCVDANGKQIGTTCTLTNVERLKQTEQENNKSQQRLKRAQSIAHIGHWEMDFATGKTVWSEETCRIYGVPTDKNVQSFESWLSLIHPGDLQHVMAIMKNSRETLTDSDVEHRILLKDGTVKFIRSISRFEFDKDNKPVGMYGNCQDITAMKIAIDDATSSTKELETYIYKSSHDLHGPLTSILGLIDVSKMEIKDPVAANYFAMIESQARKLSSVREQFIRAMQIKDGANNTEPVLVRELINQILEVKATSPAYSRMQVHLNMPQEVVLHSNQFLLRTILENLIQNAVRFQDYAKSTAILNIDVFVQGKCTKIEIQDNGIGISQEIQHRVFEMYFKGTNSADGAGLGLYLAKKATDRLNGRLDMKSTAAVGTTFVLSLPN